MTRLTGVEGSVRAVEDVEPVRAEDPVASLALVLLL